MSAEQVAADLRAAAEVLRRDGWTQNTYHDDRGSHCLIGALDRIYAARTDDATEEAAYAELEAVVGRGDLTTWNDAAGRTADEVIAALEAAAEAVQ